MYLVELNKIKGIETKEEMELRAKDLSNNGYEVFVEVNNQGFYSIQYFRGFEELKINE